MKIEYIHEKGIGSVNEDSYLIENDIFRVFDGATSLDGYIDKEGRTGGLKASAAAKKTFQKNNKSLRELAIASNQEIRKEMMSENIDIDKKINLWSTSAAVVRINKDNLEWLQLGDSLILIISKDGSYKLLVNDYDHDEKVLIMWKESADKKTMNIKKELMPQIIKNREKMNINYGTLDGEESMVNFINDGTLSLGDIKHVLLFTDGLIIPKKNPRDKDDFDTFVKLYLDGGLASIKEHVRQLEKEDPDCWIYPRCKQHDDITSISITFN